MYAKTAMTICKTYFGVSQPKKEEKETLLQTTRFHIGKHTQIVFEKKNIVEV